MKKRGNIKSEYIIPFSGLKEARHSFEFELEKKFFDTITDSLVDDGEVKVDFVLEKRSTMLVLEFSIAGQIVAECDRCTDAVKIDIESQETLYVKFGIDTIDDNDDIIMLDESDYEIDIAPFIYEFIVLAVPSRKVHPEGMCNEEYMNKLEEYIQLEEIDSEDEDEDDDIDPRWAALRNIK